MAGANLLGYLWAEIVRSVNMIRNFTPCEGFQKTPHEMWTGLKPNLKKLRVIGCKAFCQLDKKKRNKFDPVCFMAVHVGYAINDTSYRVWCPESKRVYNCGHPAFDESVEPGWWKTSAYQHGAAVQFPVDEEEEDDAPCLEVIIPAAAAPAAPAAALDVNLQVEAIGPDHGPHQEAVEQADDLPPDIDSTPSSPTSSSNASLAGANDEDDNPVADEISLQGSDEGQPEEEAVQHMTWEDESDVPPPPRRSTRPGRGVPSSHYRDMLMVAEEGTSETDPTTYIKAMKQKDKQLWKDACGAEVSSLKENKVYSIVDRPQNKTVIPSKWIFKRKRDVSGKVVKHKARVVAKGFMQEAGINYFETFAPTVRQESIRLMAAISASNGWHMVLGP